MFIHQYIEFLVDTSLLYCITILFLVVNEPPLFTVTPKNAEVKEGDKVVIKCKAHGKPVPAIAWNKDGLQLASSDDINVETVAKEDKYEAESTLTINSSLLDDESETYTIDAVNSCGDATHTFSLAGLNNYEGHIKYLCHDSLPYICRYFNL